MTLGAALATASSVASRFASASRASLRVLMRSSSLRGGGVRRSFVAPPPPRRSFSTAARALASTAPPLRTYHADWAEVILPDGHRFPMEKYRATRLALEADGSLRGKMEILPSPLATIDQVLAVHDPGYVQRVLDCALTPAETRAIGFPMHPSSVTRSLASTGGTVAATRDVLTPGTPRRCAAQIAGGTHHAFADAGEGFCVFNDIACAAVYAMETFPERLRGSETPILIIDLDVHQGNGTAKIFEDETRVVTFSAHGEKNYPWRTKQRSTHDVDLPDGADDATCLRVVNEWVPFLFETYRPRLVFFQAGVDALREDSFGRLGMTRAGMLRRNHVVYDACVAADVPLVITMGGGYSRPVDASVAAHADVFRSAAYRFAAG